MINICVSLQLCRVAAGDITGLHFPVSLVLEKAKTHGLGGTFSWMQRTPRAFRKAEPWGRRSLKPRMTSILPGLWGGPEIYTDCVQALRNLDMSELDIPPSSLWVSTHLTFATENRKDFFPRSHHFFSNRYPQGVLCSFPSCLLGPGSPFGNAFIDLLSAYNVLSTGDEE